MEGEPQYSLRRWDRRQFVRVATLLLLQATCTAIAIGASMMLVGKGAPAAPLAIVLIVVGASFVSALAYTILARRFASLSPPLDGYAALASSTVKVHVVGLVVWLVAGLWGELLPLALFLTVFIVLPSAFVAYHVTRFGLEYGATRSQR